MKYEESVRLLRMEIIRKRRRESMSVFESIFGCASIGSCFAFFISYLAHLAGFGIGIDRCAIVTGVFIGLFLVCRVIRLCLQRLSR